MTAPLLQLDLHDVLAEQLGALTATIPDLQSTAVDLWEGGVRVRLDTCGTTVLLKICPRDDAEKAYVRTLTTQVALELPPGVAMQLRAERVVMRVLEWLDELDQGQLVLRKYAPDEEAAAAAAAEEQQRDAARPASEAEVAVAALHLGELELACHADQRRVLAGWGLDDVLLVLMSRREDLPAEAVRAARLALVDEAAAQGVRRAAVGGLHVIDHPDLGAVLSRLSEAGFTEVSVEVPASDAARVPELAAGGATRVVVRGDAQGGPEVVAAARAAGLAVLAWLPGTEAVVGELESVVPELREAGAEVWLVPAHVAGEPPSANPLDLSDVADRCDLTVAGLPICFAPSRPHVSGPLPLWRLGEDGTRFGVVCRHCTARESCPGVTPDHLARWQTRGMIPVLDL